MHIGQLSIRWTKMPENKDNGSENSVIKSKKIKKTNKINSSGPKRIHKIPAFKSLTLLKKSRNKAGRILSKSKVNILIF
jgi:hypothetical protein